MISSCICKDTVFLQHGSSTTALRYISSLIYPFLVLISIRLPNIKIFTGQTAQQCCKLGDS